jgi:uncharacterized protein YecA (UPF0149 family)
VQEQVLKSAMAAYEAKEAAVGAELLHLAERQVLLQLADQFWKDHLLAMDRLRDGVSLRGYGQKNPLLEYKKEGFHLFQLMQSLRDEAVVQRILRMEPELLERFAQQASSRPRRLTPEDIERQIAAQRARAEAQAIQQAREAAAAASALPELPPLVQTAPRAAVRLPEKGAEARLFAFENGLRRNDPCPCGSGLKYKKCCYDEAEEAAMVAAQPPAPEPPPAEEAVTPPPVEAGEELAYGSGEAAPEAPTEEEPKFTAGAWMPQDVGVLGGEEGGAPVEERVGAEVAPAEPEPEGGAQA